MPNCPETRLGAEHWYSIPGRGLWNILGTVPGTPRSVRARGRRLDVVPDAAAARGHHAQCSALLEDDAFPADPCRPRDASGGGKRSGRQRSTGFQRPGQERRRGQARKRGLGVKGRWTSAAVGVAVGVGPFVQNNEFKFHRI